MYLLYAYLALLYPYTDVKNKQGGPRTSMQPNHLPDWAVGIDEEEAMDLFRFLDQDPLPQRKRYRSLKETTKLKTPLNQISPPTARTNSTTKQQSSSGLHILFLQLTTTVTIMMRINPLPTLLTPFQLTHPTLQRTATHNYG